MGWDDNRLGWGDFKGLHSLFCIVGTYQPVSWCFMIGGVGGLMRRTYVIKDKSYCCTLLHTYKKEYNVHTYKQGEIEC